MHHLQVVITLLFASLVACAVPGPSEPAAQITLRQQQWNAQDIRNYRISVLKVQSIWHAQTNTLTVADGNIIDQSAVCTPAPFEGRSCTVQAFDPEEFTVPGLFATALKYAPESAKHQLRVTFDEKLHYPTTISRDDPNATDDDTLWRVTSFEILR
jgi:hypothetical protein